MVVPANRAVVSSGLKSRAHLGDPGLRHGRVVGWFRLRWALGKTSARRVLRHEGQMCTGLVGGSQFDQGGPLEFANCSEQLLARCPGCCRQLGDAVALLARAQQVGQQPASGEREPVRPEGQDVDDQVLLVRVGVHQVGEPG